MKRISAILISLLVAAASIACFVPAFAAEGDELLNWEPSAECLAGDTWSISDGMFCGPLQCPDRGTAGEAKDADGNRVYPTKECIPVTLADGTTGAACRFAVDAEEGYDNFGNYYGLGAAGLQPNTKYTAVIVIKFTGNEGRTNPVLGFGDTKVNLPACTEWTEVSLEFTTGATVESPSLCVGPDGFVGEAAAGYELLLASMKLYEGGAPAATGDASLAAVAVIAVALAASVVFSKKKAF